MTLKSEREAAVTRKKLARLEATYEHMQSDLSEDPHVREVSLRSLKRYINQFKEEIARFEARQPAQH